eukprot:TRINITY_DN8533_c0_g1_i2.p1 TRINITY_DN8533_c0_g1~~TRINITY_DN8533_c0_g1_i2.p1  ORF type:complete len:190 (+),score=23.76 TRINITY_DN8533_c0_g1_i2:3-572(+)
MAASAAASYPTARALPHGFKQKLLTLVFAFNDDRSEILLGMKKRGFGANRYNGFGGKVERGETIAQGAARELQEEACIAARAEDLRYQGHILFEFLGDDTILDVHVFVAETWSGTPAETEEMRPKWFSINNVPFDSMWVDDRHWFPWLLQGCEFSAYFEFDGEQTITRKHINNNITASFTVLKDEAIPL